MSIEKTNDKINPKTLLSVLWTFLTVNYIYCDVFTHSNPADLRMFLNGGTDTIKITPEFLFIFAIIMEIPMIMIILSRILSRGINRWMNIAAAILLTMIQFWSLLGTGSESTPHYIFFSIIEILCNLFIIIYSWISFKPANYLENK